MYQEIHPEQILKIKAKDLFGLPVDAEKRLRRLEPISGLWITANAIPDLCRLLVDIQCYKDAQGDDEAEKETLLSIGKTAAKIEGSILKAIEATGQYVEFMLEDADLVSHEIVNGLKKALENLKNKDNDSPKF